MAKLADLASFFREMQYQLNAGMGVVQALSALETHPSPSLRRVIPKLREDVSNGKTLSSALKKFPDIFSPLIVNLVMAGEAEGKLADACANVANLLERDVEFRRNLSLQTLYPKILLVVGLFLIFVFPPLIKGLLLGDKASLFLGLRYMLLAGLLVALYFTFVKLIIPPRVSRIVSDALKSNLPGISGLSRRFALARFLFTLSHLYMAGIPVDEALELAAESAGSSEIEKKVEAIKPELRKGQMLSVALDRVRLLPPFAINMLRAGEEGGRIPEALEVTARRLEEEAVASGHRWVTISAVGFYLLVAGAFAIYIVSFYLGYYGALLNNP